MRAQPHGRRLAGRRERARIRAGRDGRGARLDLHGLVGLPGNYSPAKDNAFVDPGLEAHAREAGPGAVDLTTRDLEWDLVPLPRALTAGAWLHDLTTDGDLVVDCANVHWTVFRWVPDAIAPLE